MNQLPPGFEDLEPFVGPWGAATMAARYAQRNFGDVAESQRFYQAICPRMDAILALTDQYPLADLPPPVLQLYRLALSAAQVSLSVENDRSTEPAHGKNSRLLAMSKELDLL